MLRCCSSFSFRALVAVFVFRYSADAAGQISQQSKVNKFKIKFFASVSEFPLKNFSECQEYSKYVHVDEQSPVLSAASNQSDKVSKCGIVETPLIVGGHRVNENEFPHMVNSGW